MANEYALQLNVKLGKGYDAHLINITGVDQVGFESNLKWCTANAAGIVSTATALEAAYGVKEIAPNVASTQVVNSAQVPSGDPSWAHRPPDAAPQQQYQQPQQQGRPAPSCAHGPMKHVPAGTSKAGRAYNAFYSCTGPRESQCKTVDA